MKKVKIKIPAKVNLTLDITGAKDGYHQIESLVASVGIYDRVVLTKRKDKRVTLICSGIDAGVKEEENNAYIAAKKFMEEFDTDGVDIILKKNIPVGAGLGGSSADTAAVILGMRKLYGVKRDVSLFASKLGSDVNYMLVGGYAVMTGRGERVQKIISKEKFYLILLLADGSVSSKECYGEFDRLGRICPPTTSAAVKLLKCRDKDNFVSVLKNDLYAPAVKICKETERNALAMEKYTKTVMTGSGSCVFGIFKKRGERNRVYKKLVSKYGKKAIKTDIIK